MAVNKVILVGNVGKDPEIRYLDENTPVCKFPLATSEVYKNRNGEKVEQTEWHNIVLWRGLAQVAEKYVKKGAQLFIEGRIKTRSYDDKDGVKRYVTEIVGDTMQMLGRKQDDRDGMGESQSQSSQSQATQSPNIRPQASSGAGTSAPQQSADQFRQEPDGFGDSGDDYSSPAGGSDDLPF